MKSQFFIVVLFGVSLYWLYMLYEPYLIPITIALLLAISTSNIQRFLERVLNHKFLATSISSIILALMFFAPLGYFLTTITLQINSIDPQEFKKVELFVIDLLQNIPDYLLFLKPYIGDFIKDIDINSITKTVFSTTAKIGTFSAGFLKNAFLVVIFYFFAQYYGVSIVLFLKRVIHMSVEETTLLSKELSSVMSVVFHSIIVNAMFQGALFGIAVSFMGYNGLLFGIMYGFASLLPIVGGFLMWFPFMIYEFSIGDNGGAIFIAIYSVIVISIIADTFIKPLIIKEINLRLLDDESMRMNELVIFFSIIAGLTTFGFWGMILGPAITAFFLTVLKLFEARMQNLEE